MIKRQELQLTQDNMLNSDNVHMLSPEIWQE